MLTPFGLLVGFAYKAFAADGTTLYVVNVCGHDSVGLPLARSMNAVDDNYIEHNGVDNLIIPISVSEPKQTTKAEFAFCIDVVVHTVLIKKCVSGHHLYRHLTEKLLALSLEWVRSEWGVQLLRESCILLGNPYYFSDVKADAKSLKEVMKMAAELLDTKESQSRKGVEDASTHLPDALNLKNHEPKESKKPLIQEVISSPGIKKGFLNGRNARLYGPEGSSEGTGKMPDPLAHIPESLRNKCKIVDTRNMEQSFGKETKSQEVPATTSTSHSYQAQKEHNANCDKLTNSKWKKVAFEQSNEKLVVRFVVPEDITSLHDVDLSATEKVLEINGVATQLPVRIVTDGVRAKFVKASHVLVVTCPIDV
ncbi:hypothetical protein ABB37_02697 [Leptomonas pyrrhocoris]|uniref:Uncharacterized protein n=1 Tax=Leptomonas pyrrhocoris TaxID=157538 RepID=A0A0N0DXH3_LEPPY|nr:hypothetical protein ABB37_02697 [Leptomonas pyrrhocoris]KPA82952.1 hypothetical protein ABB37_02697 [Leptomonas pyrrhocoris]|eukprot:XP_015661391.1 hypothetical protein ABB37_02697 [Leptomonas pyrrhocoris]